MTNITDIENKSKDLGFKLPDSFPKESKDSNPLEGDLNTLIEHMSVRKKDLDLFNRYKFDIVQLNSSHANWTQDQKTSLAANYVTSGNISASARKAGIPVGVARLMQHSAPWWPALVDHCRQIAQDKLDTKITGVIDSALTELEKKISERLSSRDLTNIIQVLYNTRDKIRGLDSKPAMGGREPNDPVQTMRDELAKVGKTELKRMNS